MTIEGLDKVKSNFVELEKVNRKGLTNLELKLTKFSHLLIESLRVRTGG